VSRLDDMFDEIDSVSPRKRRRSREQRRLRLRRHGRRAYIRSVYFLPSLATLGNAVCGFGAICVATIVTPGGQMTYRDPWANFLAHLGFAAAAYLIFLAMAFDALDGRLARFARHTSDFGGQLDSLADVVSFGVAPAFIALRLFRQDGPEMGLIPSRLLWAIAAMYLSCAAIRLARFNVHTTDFGGQLDSLADVISFGCAPAFIALQLLHSENIQLPEIASRLVWAIGALYMSCAAIRLARFNVSNEHGEQHHFSFLGLPSPGAAGAVAGLILMQQDLAHQQMLWAQKLGSLCVAILPAVVLCTGLLMVSNFRYPHLVNRYLRGKRSISRLLFVFAAILLLIVAHQYAIGIGVPVYAFWGPVAWMIARTRRWTRPAAA